jgi:formate-dependent nitrite reductase membrane component NrfD
MNDSDSYVAQIINRDTVAVRRPEKETLPKLFYKGAHQATLDPLAARRPEGGLFMWSEQQEGSTFVTSGSPNFNNSSAAALLSYDVAHSIPWDWRVSLYTWTKGIASGVYLVACLLVLLGALGINNSVWLWSTPIISGGFLAITGALLLWDLEHPERFYLIFTRPQWRSWLVKGAFIIAGYTLVLALHFIASLAGWRSFQIWLMIAGIPLSILTAVYTAYLFAQAKARDMWQNPLLPPHLAFQALLLGSAVLLILLRNKVPVNRFSDLAGYDDNLLLWALGITSLIHLLMVWGEVSLTHPTAHARLAIWEMVNGRYKVDFWVGIILSFLGGILPLLAALGVLNISIGVGGAPLALIGLMLFENAYVQAGQSVPLA